MSDRPDDCGAKTVTHGPHSKWTCFCEREDGHPGMHTCACGHQWSDAFAKARRATP
jgi:hypothetical protein